jgi:GR25 family glycosyltransferase involved in LPS biosynthesis
MTPLHLLLPYIMWGGAYAHQQQPSQAYIIALEPHKALVNAQHAAHFLRIPNVTVFPAINATEALLTSGLSLYTKYLLFYQSRHDHMQLSTAPMLGCLLSHMHLWGTIQPNQTIAIFEEDALFDENSAQRFFALQEDLQRYYWDILMLESGSLIANGP